MPDPSDGLVTPSTALVVSAFVRQNHIAASDVAALITAVHSALASLGEAPPAPSQQPAVPLRRLVTPDKVYCAECGKPFKSLRRHLMANHGLTPSAYRAKWGLKKDHPVVAPNYSASRSSLAVSRGLGRKAGSGESSSGPPAAPGRIAKAQAQEPPATSSNKPKPRRAKRGTATKQG